MNAAHIDLCHRKEAGHDHVALLLELLDGRGVQRTAHRVGRTARVAELLLLCLAVQLPVDLELAMKNLAREVNKMPR